MEVNVVTWLWFEKEGPIFEVELNPETVWESSILLELKSHYVCLTNKISAMDRKKKALLT